MTENQKKQLKQQLWNIANQLRGKMNADEFRDYCLGFIFYKYLSDKLHQHVNKILRQDGIDFDDIDESIKMDRKCLSPLVKIQLPN